jgi:dipeptidyl aminopeptidase/acylaminoacyl peptidase
MTAVDPLTTLLQALDRPSQPRQEFAEALRARALAELRATEAPARRPRSWPRPVHARRVRVAVLAGAILIVLAAIAGAAYLVTRAPAPPIRPQSGQLTLPRIRGNGPATIAAVTPDGHLQTLWRCARRGFCGTISSLAWSPDGKRVAFTVDEIGGRSAYIGLHIVDLAGGKDIHIPDLPRASPTRPQSMDVLTTLVKRAVRTLGCGFPEGVAWSPDSRSLAYACPQGLGLSPGPSRIFVIGADGSGRRLVPTGVRTALWPSWSPDGRQIAFATARVPRARTRSDTNDPYVIVRSSVYSVDLDGSHRRLLASEATAPSWSPDGSTIAYQSSCGGIGLVSPAGENVTPGAEPGACAAIGRPGAPAWSPDGRQIAIESHDRLYVMHPDGSNLRRVRNASGTQAYDTGRPAWAPGSRATRGLQRRSDTSCGGPCL